MKKAKFEYTGEGGKFVAGRKVKKGDIIELPESFSHNEFKKLKGDEKKSNDKEVKR